MRALSFALITGLLPLVAPPSMAAQGQARARLLPTEGHTANGSVSFRTMDGRVAVEARLSGLAPSARFALRVHEFGDCEASDASSAGRAFDPRPRSRRDPSPTDPAVHRLGDLPSLVTDAEGNAVLNFVLEDVSIGTGSSSDLVLRSVVVHTLHDASDLATGDASVRLACGVIQ